MAEFLKAKLAFYDVPSSDLDKAREFYGALLGSSLPHAPDPEHKVLFHPISASGIDLTVHPREDRDPPEIPIAYFAVDKLDETIRELESRGGKTEGPRLDIPLPTAERADEVLERAEALGYERRDLAALFQALEQMADHDDGHRGRA